MLELKCIISANMLCILLIVMVCLFCNILFSVLLRVGPFFDLHYAHLFVFCLFVLFIYLFLIMQLLTSTVKLFFKRPPEVQKMLGRLLDSVISNEMHQDVHDRALLYYRLLSTNHQEVLTKCHFAYIHLFQYSLVN